MSWQGDLKQSLGIQTALDREIHKLIINKGYPCSVDDFTYYSLKVNWCEVFKEFLLSERFLEKFSYRYNSSSWRYASYYQDLSETFIKRYKHLVYWDIISERQYLTLPFLIEMEKYIYWDNLRINHKISWTSEMKRKFKDKL